MRATVAACTLLVITSILGMAQDRSQMSGEEGRIRALKVAWNHAEQVKDARALSQLLAETLVYVDYDGTLMNKGKFLAHTKKRSQVTQQLINEGMTVHMYGNTAVVTGAYRDKGTEKGKPYSRRGRFTDTWVKQSGTWLCVASQTTLINH